jgi:Icc-related predicted phosphoesterase
MSKVNIVAISDTHNKHKKLILPEGDIIIHAGDATIRGEKDEVINFLKWFGSLDYQENIFVPGNHDFLFEKNPDFCKELCNKYNVTLLNDSMIDLNGIRIWGSPITPWYNNWAFNRFSGDDIQKHWNKIPKDDVSKPHIIVTHGPVYGILDELEKIDGTKLGKHAGCKMLLKTVLDIKPKIHISGHIHCGYGNKNFMDIDFYNVSICDEMYIPKNLPTIIEYNI